MTDPWIDHAAAKLTAEELAEKVVAELYYLPDGYDDFCALVRECAARLRGKAPILMPDEIEAIIFSLHYFNSDGPAIESVPQVESALAKLRLLAQGADNRKE